MKDVNLLLMNGVNVNGSLELFGDMEIYNETMQDFLNGVYDKLEKIKNYKEASDMGNYAILVHSLKSDSKYLGFTRLADLAYQHEMASKGNDVNFVFNNYDTLMTEANRIVKLVSQYMGQEVKVAVQPQTSIIKDKTILVVDDSDLIRNLVGKIFNNEYEIIMARDGKEAIDYIGTNYNSNLIGMLLDLNMPNVDGFEVLEYLKNNNLFMKIPVSIITGDDTRETVQRAFSYPIVDVLNKPFNERDVKRVVSTMLNFK